MIEHRRYRRNRQKLADYRKRRRLLGRRGTWAIYDAVNLIRPGHSQEFTGARPPFDSDMFTTTLGGDRL